MKLFLSVFMIIILSFQLRAARSDDFETGDFSSLDWQMNSYTPWLISGYQAVQGNFCARTGYVLDGQISILAYTLETTEVGEISFSWKSTLLGNDIFAFYINNVELASLSGY
ncbi:MAG: hypothetical protein JW996_03670, partial [Candidatus Cloacimonetes bacterium]|nr:hypothetical protein [Candidatus Cloacimonadota bacterium]